MNLIKTLLLNSKGMSLIAVLVASAVGSVVVIGMTQYQTNLLNSINEIKQEGDLTIVRSQIERKFFSKDDSGAHHICTDTLKSFKDIAGNVDSNDRPIQEKASATSSSDKVHYKKDQLIKATSIKIQKIVAKAGTANDKEVDLYIYFASNKKNKASLPISRPLILTADVSYDTSSSSSSLIVESCTGGGAATPVATSPDCLTAVGFRTLLGCGTTKDNRGQYTVAIGYNTGSSRSTGYYNNFIGSLAGYRNTTGHSNNFMGAQAGFSNTTGRWNNFMGHKAGSINITGDGNICFGFKSCGGRLSSAKHADNQAELTTFKATSSTKGIVRELRTTDINSRWSISVNLKPLKKFSKIASLTSKPLDSSFNEVVALGNLAGSMNSGDKNVFVGSQSGQYNLIGEHNTFLGYNSGLYSRLGDHNTYIGAEVGASKKDSSSYPKKDKSYQLNLANTLYGNINKKPSYPFPIKDSSLVFDSHLTISKDLEVIGDIKTKKDINILGSLKAKKANIKQAKLEKANIKYLEVDYLKVNNPQHLSSNQNNKYNNPQYIASYQNPLSSKQYKKNIESYDNHEDSLNQILAIKLYNYNYKAKDHNPNKQRMGVISEYLDPIFQIKDHNIIKNKKTKTKTIIMPDWPTIYGSLIASVKSIYNKLTNLIKDFQDFKKIMSSQLDKTNKELIKTNKELKDSNNRFNKELLQIKQEMLELKKQMEVKK